MRARVTGVALLTGLFWACEKAEQPLPAAPEGLLTAGMGVDYRSTLYFNLNTGAFVQTSDRDGFHLAFSSDENDTAIYLNSFNFMFAKPAGDTTYAAITDTIGGVRWRYDYPDGDARRTALKGMFKDDGLVNREVYVVDLGYDADLNRLPFWKLQLQSYDANGYRFRYGPLDGSEVYWAEVQRQDGYRRVMYDLFQHQAVNFEPPREDWHLCFTQYTDFDLTTAGDTLAYLVRGVLMDGERLRAQLVEGSPWESFQLADALSTPLSADENIIGYDWKRYDFDLFRYLIEPERIYVIDAGTAGFFKMRFLDYYNDAGERGYARFEMVGL